MKKTFSNIEVIESESDVPDENEGFMTTTNFLIMVGILLLLLFIIVFR